MLTVHSYADNHLVNGKAYIQHPLADEVSIAIGDGAMATFPYTVELAFFKNGDWVSEILPEFAAYADPLVDSGDWRPARTMDATCHSGPNGSP